MYLPVATARSQLRAPDAGNWLPWRSQRSFADASKAGHLKELRRDRIAMINCSWNAANGRQCELEYTVDTASQQQLIRQPLRRGTWRTNGPAPRSPNSVTTKYFTGIKRAPPKTSKASPSSAFFFRSGLWRSTESERVLPAALSWQRTPPNRIVHFSSTASAAQPLWCLSEELPDRPTRAPGGPCDLNLFLSSTTK